MFAPGDYHVCWQYPILQNAQTACRASRCQDQRSTESLKMMPFMGPGRGQNQVLRWSFIPWALTARRDVLKSPLHARGILPRCDDQSHPDLRRASWREFKVPWLFEASLCKAKPIPSQAPSHLPSKHLLTYHPDMVICDSARV